MTKVIIQIPCHNEEAVLGPTLSELPRNTGLAAAFMADGVRSVEDRISAETWEGVHGVAMSRPYQDGHLQGWLDLSDQLSGLKPGDPPVVERRLDG